MGHKAGEGAVATDSMLHLKREGFNPAIPEYSFINNTELGHF